jgi:hypothetical protein
MEYTSIPDMKPPECKGALEYARKRLIGELLPILRYQNLVTALEKYYRPRRSWPIVSEFLKAIFNYYR